MTEDRQPGLIARIRFSLPVTVGVVAAIAVIPAAWAYAHFSQYKDLIVFVGVAATGAATAVSAYYAAQSLIAARHDASEALAREKERAEHATQKERVVTAFEYMRRWNDPLFSRTKRRWRVILAAARANPGATWTELEADTTKRAVVQDVLNFFETLALVIKKELADEEVLKSYFKGILVDYYTVFEGYIKQSRVTNRNPTGYMEMEELQERWAKS